MTNPPTPAVVDRRSLYKKLAISLLPALAFVWVLKSGGLPLLPAREDLARVDVGGLVLFVFVWFAHYFVRTARWYLLLAPIQRVPLWTVIRVACIGFLAVGLLPFRMGEAVRPILIRREGKLTAWAATGTVGAERVVDGLSISLILLISLRIAKPLDPLPDRIGELPIPAALVPGAAYVMALVFAGGCAVMMIFYFWRNWARKMTEAVIGVVSKPLATWLATRVEQVAEGLGFLRDARYAVPFLLATLLYWTLNASTWWVLAHACGLGEIGFFGAAATMGVVALGILVPATPGFFGAFQLGIYCGLAMYLAPAIVMREGSVYSFLGYALPMGLATIVGVVALLLRPRTENLAGSRATG
jgi:hypothetical protein